MMQEVVRETLQDGKEQQLKETLPRQDIMVHFMYILADAGTEWNFEKRNEEGSSQAA